MAAPRSSTRCGPRPARCATASASGQIAAVTLDRRRRRDRTGRREPAAGRHAPLADRASSTPPASSSTRISDGRRSPTRRWRGSRLSRAGYTNLEYDLERGTARPARRARRTPHLAADGRRRRRRRQQQRRRDDADSGGAGRRTRGHRVARRAGGDRRRIPRPRRDGPVGRAAEGGRDDQPDPRGRLRGRHHRAHRPDPARASRRTSGLSASRAADHRGARRRSVAGSAFRSPRISGAAGSDGPTWRGALRRCGTSRSSRTASKAGSTSSVSAETSCSADRRRASSPDSASRSSGSAGTR